MLSSIFVPKSSPLSSILIVTISILCILTSQPNLIEASSSYSGSNEGSSGDSYSQPNYKFQYGVYDSKYDNDFGHQEERNGYSTKGMYRVKLPDGRVQIVNYWADKNGYNAQVTYEQSSGYSSSHTNANTNRASTPTHDYAYMNNNHQKSYSNHAPSQSPSRSNFSSLKTKINGIYYGY